MLKLFENDLLLVETEAGRIYITNKDSGHRAELTADYDGFFTLHMLP